MATTVVNTDIDAATVGTFVQAAIDAGATKIECTQQGNGKWTVKVTSDQQQEDAAFEELMALREGRKNKVYRDTLGKLTVGIGHLVLPEDHLKLDDTITDEQVSVLFKKDGAAAMAAARSQAVTAGITDSAFLPYLASVNFQLGTKWTATFPHTWQMIVDGDYENAANALDGTTWEKQTPVRVKDFQDALRKLPKKK